MSQRTGNIALELEALHHSKSILFVCGLPFDSQKIHLHAFYPLELENLASAAKLTPAGRFYAYRHTRIGEQADNEGVLIPREIVRTVGLPFATGGTHAPLRPSQVGYNIPPQLSRRAIASGWCR